MERRISQCLYHPDQIITNFCRDKQCLMPLCPVCIGEHSQYHAQCKTKPNYHSISEVLTEVQSLIHNSIYSLEQDRKRNSYLFSKIQTLGDFVKEKVLNAKSIVYNIIDQTFVELEKDLKDSLMRLHEDTGLHSVRRTQKNQQILAESLKELYSVKQGLKFDKYLGNMIIYLKDKHNQSNSLHTKIQSFLKANQNYEPRLEFNKEAKQNLVSTLNRIIKIDKGRQQKKNLERSRAEFRNQSRQSVIKRQRQGVQSGRKQKISLSKKNPTEEQQKKIQRSYTPERAHYHQKSNEEYRLRNNEHYAVNNSPYRQKMQSVFEQGSTGYYVEPQSARKSYVPSMPQMPAQYEVISRKVNQMRLENQILSRQHH